MDAIRNDSEKPYKKYYSLFLPMVFVLVIGCSTGTTITPTPSSEEALYTPVAAPTTTHIPIPSPLPLDEAQSELQNLLSDNGGCKLPCFWNIFPGDSLFQELVSILNPLSGLSNFTQFESHNGTISPDYVTDELIIHTSIQYLADPSTKVITAISFNAVALNKIGDTFIEAFESPDFNKLLSYYQMPNILTENGNPSSVLISTMAKLPSSGASHGGFNILILYPEQGILVNYTMQMVVDDENIKGCPSNSHIELKLFVPNQKDLFFELLEPSGWKQITQNVYKPIDEVTSITKDDFYRIFSEPTDECILTPANLWPVPD